MIILKRSIDLTAFSFFKKEIDSILKARTLHGLSCCYLNRRDLCDILNPILDDHDAEEIFDFFLDHLLSKLKLEYDVRYHLTYDDYRFSKNKQVLYDNF